MCTGVGRQAGRRADEDEAMATAAAPPGCDQQHDQSRGKKRGLTPGGETASMRRASQSFPAAA